MIASAAGRHLRALACLIGMALLLVLILRLFLSTGLPSLTAAPLATGAVATCDCKPEFNVIAEGPNPCTRTKDDAKWCRIKFPVASDAETRKMEFDRVMQELDLPRYNVAAAAVSVNRTRPDAWDLVFVQRSLPPLVAVALWDLEPRRIKPLVRALSERAVAARVLEGWQSKPPGFVSLSAPVAPAPYRVIVSRGCVEFVDGLFSLLIRTSLASASRGCMP
jgi:hypothetical protein